MMNFKNKSVAMAAASSAVLSFALFGAPPALALDNAVAPLVESWAVCQYQKSDKKLQQNCFEALSLQADKTVVADDAKAQLWIWSGIIKSSWAGAKGGLGALGLVKEAKTLFEKAIVKDPTALNGAALTSLGTLYYQVPGWPIGFGDDKKAQLYLEKGLAAAPSDIDANFFYGDFWLQQGEKAKAKNYLEKALTAPDRAGRKVADEGRRAEIKARLATLSK
ncbi:MAG: tetratricopeptide repeat protein [Vibrionaceae bacterium]